MSPQDIAAIFEASINSGNLTGLSRLSLLLSLPYPLPFVLRFPWQLAHEDWQENGFSMKVAPTEQISTQRKERRKEKSRQKNSCGI